MKKRIVASLLSLCMVLTLLPVTAFAAGEVELKASDFTVTSDSLAYTGEDQASAVTVTYTKSENQPDLAEGVTLTPKFKQGTTDVTELRNAGAYDVWVEVAAAENSYTAFNAKVGEITIAPMTVGEGAATVTIGDTDLKYTGNPVVPQNVTVAVGGKTLTENTDYTVAYTNNTNAGEATATVTFKGNYSGTATQKFTIGKADQTITVSPASLTVNKGGATGEFTVSGAQGAISFTGEGFSSGGDAKFSIAVKPGSDGTYTCTVTGEGKTSGPVNVTINAAGNSNYNPGSATIKITVTELPEATVSFAEKTKTITFGDAAPTNALTAKYTAEDGTETIISEGITYTSLNTDVATVAADGTVTIVGAGETTITATVEDSADTYVGASASYTLTVNPKELKDKDYNINGKNGLKYTGAALEGVESITITNGSETITLKAGTDYTIVYSNNVNASEKAIATITFTGNYTGGVVYTFTIGKATAATLTLNATVNNTTKTVDLSKTANLPSDAVFGAVTLGEGSKFSAATVSGKTLTLTYKADIAEDGTESIDVSFTSGNYEDGSKVTVTVTLTAKKIAEAKPTSVSLKVAGAGTTVTDAENKATVIVTTDGDVTNATSANTSIATVASEGKTVTITGVAKGTTTVTITTSAGTEYAAGSFTISVTVTEKTSSGGGGGGSTGGGGYTGGGGGGTGGTTSDPTTSGGTTSSIVTTTTSGGNATANVSSTTANKLVSQAVENKSTNVTVKVEAGSNVNSVTTQIPASAVDTLAKGSNASLTVDTPVADVVIPNSTLATLGSSSGTVTVKAAVASDKSLTVNVQKNGQDVGALPAPIKVSTPVSETGSGVVAVLVNADGTETVLPKSTLNNGEMSLLLETGSATVKFENRAKDFTDVDGHWASNAIDFVSSHGLFQGVTTTTFGASTDTSRAMMVTVLHRLESEPAASGVSFDDVPTGSYYAEAAAWAADLGITQGNGNGFDGDADISREMMVTMLYRYVQKTAPGTGSMGSYAGMTGSNQVSSWAAEAMNWAVGSGLIQGDAKGLRPGDSTSRAEMAAVMQRFVGLLTK